MGLDVIGVGGVYVVGFGDCVVVVVVEWVKVIVVCNIFVFDDLLVFVDIVNLCEGVDLNNVLLVLLLLVGVWCGEGEGCGFDGDYWFG